MSTFPFPIRYSTEDILKLSKAMLTKTAIDDDYLYKETDDSHAIEIAMLGHSSDSVSIYTEDGFLHVKTKDSVKVSDLAQNYSFKFKLPAGSDQSAISAEMANGILKVVVKKNANRHQIEVK